MWPSISPSRLLPWWPLALCLLAFAGGWAVNGWRWEARQAAAVQEQLDARVRAEQDAATKSAALESKLARMDADNRKLTRRLADETAKPGYRCVIPSDGVLLRSEAITGPAPGEHD